MTPEQLKASILQYAVQGKLVEQRPEEGTAEELYQQIQKEKEKLIKEKKIKREKPLDAITEEEIPFDIPDSWKWVKVNDLVSKTIKRGKSPTYTESSSIQVFAQKCNVKSGGINMDIALFLDENKFDKYPEEEYMQNNDIVINSTGTGTMGRVGIFHDTDRINNMIIVPDSHVTVVRASKYVYPMFLYHFLKNNQPYLEGKGEGSTNQKELKPITIMNMVIPLPPLEEQHRIAAKIEQLLPYVDRYAAFYEKLEQFNVKFPEDMKKSILQYAIQGKLVEQRPEEGTAEGLFEQIQKEKEKLIKEKKIKKEKPLDKITEEEIPFDIPESWKWERLGNILVIERGGSPRPIKEFLITAEDGINWIKIGDTDKGGKYINSTNERIIPEGMKKSRYVQKGDFLLSNSMSFGRPYILNIDGCIHDGWLVLRQPVEIFDKDFLYYLLSSSMVFHQFCGRVAGAVVNNLNSDKVALTLVPIPPMHEQRRIAQKIEQLLPYCDRLINA